MQPFESFRDAQQRLLEHEGLDAASRFVDVPSIDGRAHVLVSGEGPPVVLVPGFGDPAALWAPLMARLEGFTCYAVDRPSFGLTSPARHDTATLRPLGVTFLREVLDALGLEQALFVGNSIGSLWTFWLAIDHPQRVIAMSHLGCPAFVLGTSAPFPMRLLSVPPIGRLLMALSPPSPAQVERFATLVGEDLSGLPELRDVLVAMQRLPGVRASLRELLHAVVRMRGARPEVALSADDLTQVAQPTQLIWGARDPFGSERVGREAAGLIAVATLHVLQDAGHAPWFARPDEAARLAAAFLRAA